MAISRRILLRMRNVSDKNRREIRTHISCSPENRVLYDIIRNIIVATAKQVRVCNAYCLFTAIMVTRTRLNTMFIRTFTILLENIAGDFPF